MAPYDEGVSILDDPLNGFAFLQFQGLGEGGGTDEVELAGLVGALYASGQPIL